MSKGCCQLDFQFRLHQNRWSCHASLLQCHRWFEIVVVVEVVECLEEELALEVVQDVDDDDQLVKEKEELLAMRQLPHY